MTDRSEGTRRDPNNDWLGTPRAFLKTRTGIPGLDQILNGGLPRGRCTLVCGGPGTGKTVLATDFIMRGILRYHEPGVFVSFENRAKDFESNAASLGYDAKTLKARKRLAFDYIQIEHADLRHAGKYDLEGIFIRLDRAIASVKAKRVVLDSIDTIFSGFSDLGLLRAELRRLFAWLKTRGVTALITSERGDGGLTRDGLEEYISDCVILLDQRVEQQVATRRLRLIKYRGSGHGSNDYPFLIDKTGVSIYPITELRLQHDVPRERTSTGIKRLDAMLSGGYWRGSSILFSGTAGTGKTTVAAHFASAVCRRGERCLFISFDESPKQIKRNLSSVGISLDGWEKKGLLRVDSVRTTVYGLEEHLAAIIKTVQDFKPSAVIIDPITSLLPEPQQRDTQLMMTRLIDFLKGKKITALMTSLTASREHEETSWVGVSTLIDSWLVVRDIEQQGERIRGVYIIKSRGMAHSNQVREFLLTDKGVELRDVYVGPAGLVVGGARLAQEALEKARELETKQEVERLRSASKHKRAILEKEVAAMRESLHAQEDEISESVDELEQRRKLEIGNRRAIFAYRKADLPPTNGSRRRI